MFTKQQADKIARIAAKRYGFEVEVEQTGGDVYAIVHRGNFYRLADDAPGTPVRGEVFVLDAESTPTEVAVLIYPAAAWYKMDGWDPEADVEPEVITFDTAAEAGLYVLRYDGWSHLPETQWGEHYRAIRGYNADDECRYCGAHISEPHEPICPSADAL